MNKSVLIVYDAAPHQNIHGRLKGSTNIRHSFRHVSFVFKISRLGQRQREGYALETSTGREGSGARYTTQNQAR
jgi:hypothetical protein